MKAALNGVPSLSVLDGWWVEGCLEGTTGWATADSNHQEELRSLYEKLERIISIYYKAPRIRFGDALGHSHQWLILQHGTHGSQYARHAYSRAGHEIP